MIIMLCGDGFRVQVEGFIVADAMLVQACSTRRGEAGVPVVKVPNVPNVKMEQLFRRTMQRGRAITRRGGGRDRVDFNTLVGLGADHNYC